MLSRSQSRLRFERMSSEPYSDARHGRYPANNGLLRAANACRIAAVQYGGSKRPSSGAAKSSLGAHCWAWCLASTKYCRLIEVEAECVVGPFLSYRYGLNSRAVFLVNVVDNEAANRANDQLCYDCP